MSYIKLALVLFNIAQYFLKEAEKRGQIREGERRQLQKQKDAYNEVITRALDAALDAVLAVDHSPDSVQHDPRNRD